MRLLYYMFTIVILSLLNTRSSLASSLAERGWLAFGDMRGYFEPCGCDPDSDLGGVERLGSFFERERALKSNLLLLTLGNNIPVELDAQAYKIEFILRGIVLMKADAYLVNELEWQYLQKQSNSSQALTLPYVLSNTERSWAGVSASIQHESAVIYGFLSPTSTNKKQLQSASVFLGRKDIKAIKQLKLPKVLLFSGTSAELKQILKANLFDEVISANSNSLKTIVDLKEKNNEALLVRNFGDRRILMTPLGGQGVLRGGALATKRAPLLKDLLKDSRCESGGLLGGDCSMSTPQQTGNLSLPSFVSWLDKSYKGLSTQYSAIAKDYATINSGRFLDIEKQRIQDLKDSSFAGAESCAGCHVKAMEVWRGSKHARAMTTLQNVKQDTNPECVACHVVGYNEKGGFASLNSSPHFANVQCENCHGPRKEHVADPSKSPKTALSSKQVCTTCHVGTHSPHFNYNSYWELIKH